MIFVNLTRAEIAETGDSGPRSPINQTVTENEAATESTADTVMTVPKPLVPAVRELIAKHQRKAGGSGSG